MFKNDTEPAAVAKVIPPVPEDDRFRLALGWSRSHRAASRNAKRDTPIPKIRRLLSTINSNLC